MGSSSRKGPAADQIEPKHLRRFFRACESLRSLQEEVKAYCPDVEFYVSDGSVHLTVGDSHTGTEAKAHHERVAAFGDVGQVDGGGW